MTRIGRADMYGDPSAYLKVERQRQRAERAEGHARRWRAVAYVLVAVMLAVLAAQAWLASGVIR